jgi:hypothetical protein
VARPLRGRTVGRYTGRPAARIRARDAPGAQVIPLELSDSNGDDDGDDDGTRGADAFQEALDVDALGP